MSKMDKMDQIKNKVLECKKCNLHKTRNNPVFGEGIFNANVMFIGEAPGKNEDKLGRPFVGRAGRIFDEMLGSIELKRENVYISNIIKCRPPKNRNPTKIEINMCSIYIDKQIELINPKVIVPLGRIAISYIFNKFGLPFEKISRIHGRLYSFNNSLNNFKIIPIYHPASVIYNNKLKFFLLEDFKFIKQNL